MDDARGNLSRGRRAWEGAAIPRRSVEESWRREAEYARFGRCPLRAARTGASREKIAPDAMAFV